MAEMELTSRSFDSEVLNSDKPVLVDFWASWCGPCRMLAPIVAEIARERAGSVKVAKVNVDEEPALANRFRVSSIPTVLVFKDGKIVNSSGEFMNIVVMSTSSEMEMLTHSMMSRRNVGRGTNITNKITTTPAASMTSPCRENLP